MICFAEILSNFLSDCFWWYFDGEKGAKSQVITAGFWNLSSWKRFVFWVNRDSAAIPVIFSHISSALSGSSLWYVYTPLLLPGYWLCQVITKWFVPDCLSWLGTFESMIERVWFFTSTARNSPQEKKYDGCSTCLSFHRVAGCWRQCGDGKK